MCCGNGGAPNNQTVTTSGLPAPIENDLESQLTQGLAASQLPYQGYSGQRVADLTPAQQQGFGAITNAAGSYQPYLDQAQQQATASAKPLAPGLGTFDAAQQQKYEDPFNQSVIDATNQEFDRQATIGNQTIAGNAASQGAYGGDRATIAQTENNRNVDMQRAQTIAGLNVQNFNQAQSQFNTEQTRGLAAGEADTGAAARAAGIEANLGTEAQGLGLQGGQAIENVGAIQQQQQQTNLNTAYGDFAEQRAYPAQQAQLAASIVRGFPTSAFQTTTTQNPAPSAVGQIAGLGTAVLGAAGAAKGFGNLFSFAEGGRVNAYLTGDPEGGTVNPVPEGPGDLNYDPTASEHVAELKAATPVGMRIHYADGGVIEGDDYEPGLDDNNRPGYLSQIHDQDDYAYPREQRYVPGLAVPRGYQAPAAPSQGLGFGAPPPSQEVPLPAQGLGNLPSQEVPLPPPSQAVPITPDGEMTATQGDPAMAGARGINPLDLEPDATPPGYAPAGPTAPTDPSGQPLPVMSGGLQNALAAPSITPEAALYQQQHPEDAALSGRDAYTPPPVDPGGLGGAMQGPDLDRDPDHEVDHGFSPDETRTASLARRAGTLVAGGATNQTPVPPRQRAYGGSGAAPSRPSPRARTTAENVSDGNGTGVTGTSVVPYGGAQAPRPGSSQPAGDDQLAPNTNADDDGRRREGTPMPNGLGAAGRRASRDADQESQDDRTNRWLPVIAAGLGMMASRSPTALGAIGEGGLKGVAEYQANRKLTNEYELRKATIESNKLWHQQMAANGAVNAAAHTTSANASGTRADTYSVVQPIRAANDAKKADAAQKNADAHTVSAGAAAGQAGTAADREKRLSSGSTTATPAQRQASDDRLTSDAVRMRNADIAAGKKPKSIDEYKQEVAPKGAAGAAAAASGVGRPSKQPEGSTAGGGKYIVKGGVWQLNQ